MSTSNISIIAGFFIGLMTAFSPCPLTTNLTAIAYISKKSHKNVLKTSIFYTLGRVFTYTMIASLIVYFGLNTQIIALFLQDYGERLIGPILLFVGVVMLEILKIELPVKENKTINKWKTKLTSKGDIESLFLGIIFSLAFCPFSAALYFGMLIPLSLSNNDIILTPLMFAIGTGLPVIILSYLLSKSVSKLNKTIKKIEKLEKITRQIMGILIILTGAYYTINFLL